MTAMSTFTPASAATHPHAEFLALIPTVERHVSYAFRGRPQDDREEAAAEAVAAAYASYVSLKARGKDPVRDFPAALIAFAVLHARVGRQVSSRNSSTDVLSPLAQRRRGFRVESLPTAPGTACDHVRSTTDRRRDEFSEWLCDNTRSAVPDQVAFRLDFPTFLSELGPRDRALVRYLALGHSGHMAATQFGMTAGRVSQLRREWRLRWRESQDEAIDDRPHRQDVGR